MKFLKRSVVAVWMLGLIGCGNERFQNASANDAGVNSNTSLTSGPQATPAFSQLTAGKDLYKQNCATCHRANGTGGWIEIEGTRINPRNLTADKYKNAADQELVRYISDGVEEEGMPAFADKLSEDEIKAIINYIRTDLQKLPAR